MSGTGYIEPEEDATCELCGRLDETRPYGPNGERVCFQCGMKDPAAIERGVRRYVLGMSEDEARREMALRPLQQQQPPRRH